MILGNALAKLSWSDLEGFQVQRHKPFQRRDADYSWAFNDRLLRLVISAYIAKIAHARRLPQTLAEVRACEAVVVKTYAGKSEEWDKLIAAGARNGGLTAHYASIIWKSIRLGEDSVQVATDLGITPVAVRQTLARVNQTAHDMLAGKWLFTRKQFSVPKGRPGPKPLWDLQRAIEMRKSGMLFKEIAAKFGVGARTVANGFEVHAPSLTGQVSPHVHTKHKFDYRVARQMRADGMTYVDIAQHLGTSPEMVRYACSKSQALKIIKGVSSN